jgi:RNA polymerase sigma-70 factor (ECF subfamily)
VPKKISPIHTGSSKSQTKTDKLSRRVLFEGFVSDYSKDLYRFGYWLSQDRSIAEDLVQETLMRAWQSIDSLKDVSAAKCWLFTILRRENFRRFKRKSSRVEVTTLDSDDVSEKFLVDTASLSVDNVLAVNEALLSLSDEYSEPLILQIIGGYSCNEIATIINIKPGAVMTRICRAKKTLHTILSAEKLQGESHV